MFKIGSISDLSWKKLHMNSLKVDESFADIQVTEDTPEPDHTEEFEDSPKA